MWKGHAQVTLVCSFALAIEIRAVGTGFCGPCHIFFHIWLFASHTPIFSTVSNTDVIRFTILQVALEMEASEALLAK